MPDPTQGIVSFDVSVTDNTGKPATALSEKDFAILDNDRQQKIVSFATVNGATVQPANSAEIVFVLDELGIGPDPKAGQVRLANVRHEVETFLHANGSVLAKPTIVYRLTRDGLFVTPHASMDGNELLQEIAQPTRQRLIWSPSAVGGDIETIFKSAGFREHQKEAVWRDITESLVALGSIAIEERRRPGRKLMFWLGNGWQITQNPKSTGFPALSIELLTRLREAHIVLWSVFDAYDTLGSAVPITDVNRELAEAPKANSTDLLYLSLPVIATRTGGGMLNTGPDLASHIAERVRERSSYYLLTFDPPRTDVVDQYHHLKIELDKPDLTAHVFEDYYDEPVFYDQAAATQAIPVKQLQSLIASVQGVSDTKLAQQLNNVRLTERLSTAKLAVLEKSVHKREEREALQVLADNSVFFAPPDDEIVASPPPEMSAQQQMIAKTISYIYSTIPHLPDLLATRTSMQYYERPPTEDETWKTAPADQSLHLAETTKASIQFRQGKELVKEESMKRAPDMQGEQRPPAAGAFNQMLAGSVMTTPYRQKEENLKTTGAFGPILGTIVTALTSSHTEVIWSRWEQGGSERLAVFRFHDNQETPFFSVGFCCLPVDNESIPFTESVPFHGEIAVDPSSGAVMRLTVQANLAWRLPLKQSDVMVEYQPVQAGSKTLIGPSSSVSVFRQRRTITIHEWGETFKVYAPFETLLNEMRFDNYHVFGSTSRILPGFTKVTENR